MFPDEERGVRNAMMTAFGFTPLGIPAPARLQPFWSGAPLRKLPEDWKFSRCHLDVLFTCFLDEALDLIVDEELGGDEYGRASKKKANA